MTRIAPEIWTRLAKEQIQGETLWARRAMPDVTDRLMAALDAAGRRHYLVMLHAGESKLQDTQSRGVGVVTRELAVPGHKTGCYLDITCHDAGGHDAFDLIGGELAGRLGAANETAPECVSRVLARWRRFWGQLPTNILSREEQVGLFAELWFLNVWMVPRVGAAAAVQRWRGPFGSRHDFERPGCSVEVKATTSTRGVIHHIHGIEQLLPPDAGELLLYSLRLRIEAGATNSLSTVVAACRQQFSCDDEALLRFESALVQAGYSPTHEEEYEKLRLRIVEEGLYVVRDDFPRLTPMHFIGGLPNGVEQVDYEVNLGGFNHLRLARMVEEAPEL